MVCWLFFTINSSFHGIQGGFWLWILYFLGYFFNWRPCIGFMFHDSIQRISFVFIEMLFNCFQLIQISPKGEMQLSCQYWTFHQSSQSQFLSYLLQWYTQNTVIDAKCRSEQSWMLRWFTILKSNNANIRLECFCFCFSRFCSLWNSYNITRRKSNFVAHPVQFLIRKNELNSTRFNVKINICSRCGLRSYLIYLCTVKNFLFKKIMIINHTSYIGIYS